MIEQLFIDKVPPKIKNTIIPNKLINKIIIFLQLIPFYLTSKQLHY